MTAPTNVFVLGLTDVQRGELETVRDADRCAFHGLLDIERLVEQERYRFGNLLDAARRELADFDGSIDAIIAHWDFPTSVLAPLLAAEHGVRAPSLESVLCCEHKYWSRLEQQASVPECVPRFSAFDPFADDPLASVELDFPFFVKPIKSFASQLSFRIEDADQFAAAVEEIRRDIGRIGEPFDEALSLIDLPPKVAGIGGTWCLAEQIVGGIQGAPEGSVCRGEFSVHGIFDMHQAQAANNFERLDYPSALPEEVQARMIDLCRRFLEHVGFDDGCFNAEFLWDDADDQLWLIEVNTRISQSHSDLFAKVDGRSNHEVAIDVALGRQPHLPEDRGRFAVAAQCHVGYAGDGVVRRVPSEQELAVLAERYPETVVEIGVAPGDRLSELLNQASDRHELGVIYIGADDREQLDERYRACLDELHIEVDPVDGS